MPIHMQLWVGRLHELSAQVPRHGGNHEKKYGNHEIFIHGIFSNFQQFHENFEPQKFGAIQ